jgi:hypothetical protein
MEFHRFGLVTHCQKSMFILASKFFHFLTIILNVQNQFIIKVQILCTAPCNFKNLSLVLPSLDRHLIEIKPSVARPRQAFTATSRPFWHLPRSYTINLHFSCFFRSFRNTLVLKNVQYSMKSQQKLYPTCSRMLVLES